MTQSNETGWSVYIICTYKYLLCKASVLQDLLESVRWSAAIFDEVHRLKVACLGELFFAYQLI